MTQQHTGCESELELLVAATGGDRRRLVAVDGGLVTGAGEDRGERPCAPPPVREPGALWGFWAGPREVR
ncbi:hypothetical protein [Streptomyces umbrinus]|uniref:hypothetical protein n=1 Tax=Streptomyces umbrinus TaxID=67370 RepID=UPI0034324065